tara:strand:+ start:36 stop:260 length:225 start_codon:yes stop_codon:yes gene_type:complete
MKSEELKKKSEELAEKAGEAEQLEELIKKAEEAEWAIQEVLDELHDFNISEPHGWLSSIVYELTELLRQRLRDL